MHAAQHDTTPNASLDAAPPIPRRQPPFGSAVVVTADGGHASVDRTFLRRAGVTRARTFHTARHALAYLREHGAELVILGDVLDDMPGLDFLRALRRDHALAAMPVVVASPDNSREAILDAAAAGCSGYMLRPYSARTLAANLLRAKRGVDHTRAGRKAVARARQAMQEERPDQAVAELEPLTTDNDMARRLYKAGCDHLAAKRLDAAIESFQRAIAVDALFAEAHMGLSRAWKAKGFPDKARLHARKAAQCYARLERHAQARRIFVDVLKTTPGTGTPMLDTAERLVRAGLFNEAAQAAAKAVRSDPDATCYARLKRACHFTTDPVDAARSLADAISREQGMPRPEILLRRIMGDVRRPRPEAETIRPGQAGAATAMHEWWAVIKYVWQVFVNDAPMARAPEPLEI